ncbi:MULTISPECIES: chemotaxis protein CheW [Nostocales]|uniref:Chemotaxis protein CheW n=3 Tax=Nostocales TaxID=1161 RepID=A0A8S9SXD6_9CYAN|nr:chemotaxis protein CheW [Tolypothrix bouteillei]KAF3884820.1 chemotaxis protein CheW [Tolypothrix bouteillei VB521301]
MERETNTEKFIVFKVADYFLGMSINDVLKVINCSSLHSTRLIQMGLVQVGNHTIKLLDLQQHLNLDSLPQLSGNESFLVITRDSEGELCGVLVHEPPDLIELPPETIRPLPRSDIYSKATPDIVSHVAVLSSEEMIKTIFLLDLKRTITIPSNHI